MVDEDFKVYLIEVNTNPCLETGSTLLARLIPNMIENALRYFSPYFPFLPYFLYLPYFPNSVRIAIDPIFPPQLNN